MISDAQYVELRAKIEGNFPENVVLYSVEGKAFFPVLSNTGIISAKIFLFWLYKDRKSHGNLLPSFMCDSGPFPLQSGVLKDNEGFVYGSLVFGVAESIEDVARSVDRQVRFAIAENWIA